MTFDEFIEGLSLLGVEPMEGRVVSCSGSKEQVGALGSGVLLLKDRQEGRRSTERPVLSVYIISS